MDSWTRLVPHPPSKPTICPGAQIDVLWVLTDKHELAPLLFCYYRYQTRSSDKTWHVYRSFLLIITKVSTISYATSPLHCCLIWCVCFAELEPTSMCDRANYFPWNFYASWLLHWTELDCAQLIYSLKRPINKRKVLVLGGRIQHYEAFSFSLTLFLKVWVITNALTYL